MNKLNLAHEPPIPQGEVVHFPRKERPKMAEKFAHGYVMSSQLYRKEVYPFLSDAARHVYFELESRINGFQKESDFVSYSQLQGTNGLPGVRIAGRAAIAKGLKELIAYGVIEVVAHGKQGMKSYRINEVSIKDQFTNETSSHKELVHVVNQTSSRTEPKLVHVVNTQKKEKDNYKNTNTATQAENSLDEILNLWKPDLNQLNVWLQCSGEMPMTETLVKQLLIEINAHYETQLKAGLLTNNQMYSKFVKWVKREFKKPAPKTQSSVQQSNLRNVNDAWGEVEQYAPVVDDVDTEGML